MELQIANLFWEEARARVLRIALEHDIKIEIAEHDDEFLYDLYDNGATIPSESEVLRALLEI